MHFLFAILLITDTANSALVLWTPKPVFFPSLKVFTTKDYTQLLNDFDNPPVLAFQANSLKQAERLHNVLNNNNTVYLLNSASDIAEDVDIQELADDTIIDPNIENTHTVVVLLLPKTISRIKRSTDNDTNEEVGEDRAMLQPEPQITGAVLYSHAVDEQDEVMVYSSRPLKLTIDNTNIYLGNASQTFMDVRESYTRLITRIVTANNQIVYLRFIFSISGGYWYLNVIEAEVNSVKCNLELASNNNITAPSHKSYHCENKTLFINSKYNLTLYLYDIQIQPDAHKHRFSNAYNCIYYTTVPILSGLFVVGIMCVGLALGLSALASIKTMDKFENSKSKPLSIKLFE